MTREEAVSKIRLSLLDEPQVITPKNTTYEEYVERCSTSLIQSVIEPKRVKINKACFPEYYLERYKSSKVWVIANSRDNWLITIENESEFALAFGNNPSDLMMLGFSSSDALAEWLG